MKYESTILKRLIDTYGVVGNPRYISEIIKEFIVRGKERFPELFTYQADWLAHIDEFGLTPDYVVSYTGQQIYAPHTKERPVKNAILKGSTKYRDIETGEILEVFEDGRNLELVSVKIPVLTTTGKNLCDFTKNLTVPFGKKEVEHDKLRLYSEVAPSRWNISITKYIFYCNIGETISITLKIKKDKYSIFGIDVLDGKILKKGIVLRAGSESGELKTSLVATSDNIVLDIWPTYGEVSPYDVTLFDVQIVKGMQTEYEPHKSNILTVNEDVELGSVGEVKDELNLLTGQLTQRTETRAYQEGDESNSEVLTDMTNTRYKLPKEVIKTVDLTILDQNGQNVKHLMSFNGGTHFTTSSQDGSLLPMLTVDVVTDLEEILMVCSSEGNTM